MAAMKPNYYVELGLDRAATCEQLAEQLKALRKKWINRQNAADTDKRQKAERMVELIREATEVLVNADERKKYDKELDKRGAAPSAAPAPVNDRAYGNSNELEGAALLDMMDSAYEDGKYNIAIAAANKALATGLVNVDVFRYLVMCYIEKGNASEAVRTVQNMINTLPQDPEAHLLAARVYLRLLNNHAQDARAHLDVLIQAGYGENSDVAALDAEYYIDTGDMALAEQKINAYLANNPHDTSFKHAVSNAYFQYAETNHTVEVGGDWYIDSEENFRNFELYCNKSLALEPDKKLADGLRAMKKRQVVPGAWLSWLACGLYAFAGFGAEMPVIGVISALAGIAMIYFSLVPNWMVERFEYHGHLCGLYEVARYIGIVLSFLVRLGWWFVKFIWNLIWAFF